MDQEKWKKDTDHRLRLHIAESRDRYLLMKQYSSLLTPLEQALLEESKVYSELQSAQNREVPLRGNNPNKPKDLLTSLRLDLEIIRDRANRLAANLKEPVLDD